MQGKLITQLKKLVAKMTAAINAAALVGRYQAADDWQNAETAQLGLDQTLLETQTEYAELAAVLNAMELEKPTLKYAKRHLDDTAAKELENCKRDLLTKEQLLKETVTAIKVNNEMKLVLAERMVDLLSDFHETANHEQSIMINETF